MQRCRLPSTDTQCIHRRFAPQKFLNLSGRRVAQHCLQFGGSTSPNRRVLPRVARPCTAERHRISDHDTNRAPSKRIGDLTPASVKRRILGSRGRPTKGHIAREITPQPGRLCIMCAPDGRRCHACIRNMKAAPQRSSLVGRDLVAVLTILPASNPAQSASRKTPTSRGMPIRRMSSLGRLSQISSLPLKATSPAHTLNMHVLKVSVEFFSEILAV